MKALVCYVGLSCLQLVSALTGPCYGYGQVMGTPSTYLKTDYAQVVASQVGNTSDSN